MRKLAAFMNVTLNGYFTDADGDMSWAHAQDEEFNSFVAENARDGGELLMGRVTYDMMAAWWPSPAAAQMMPDVARGMNRMPKWVASRTLKTAAWANAQVLQGDLEDAVRRLKMASGPDIAILGSGSIVMQLAEIGLLDEIQIVVNPVALGAGRTFLEGVTGRLEFELAGSRVFANGKVFLRYSPV